VGKAPQMDHYLLLELLCLIGELLEICYPVSKSIRISGECQGIFRAASYRWRHSDTIPDFNIYEWLTDSSSLVYVYGICVDFVPFMLETTRLFNTVDLIVLSPYIVRRCKIVSIPFAFN